MSITLGEAPPHVPFDVEAWNKLLGDDKRGAEPYPVNHLIGKAAAEERLLGAEDRLERGLPLSIGEVALLAAAEEDLRSDYYR